MAEEDVPATTAATRIRQTPTTRTRTSIRHENRTFAVDSRSSACSRICLQQEDRLRWRQQQHQAASSRPCSSSSSSSSSSSPTSLSPSSSSVPKTETESTTRTSCSCSAPLRSGPSSPCSSPSSSPFSSDARVASTWTHSSSFSLSPFSSSSSTRSPLSLMPELCCRRLLLKRGCKFLPLLLLLMSLTCFRSCFAAKGTSSGSSSLSSSSAAQKASLVTINNKEDVCHNFTVGDRNKGEFYSPRYPNDYPNNTECVSILSAPFGSFIKVEFRDSFSLEESETCEYDRLEIRNGQFGYSDLIDKICGHSFPPEISSTDNYLWMRFKSDESIEYSGFRAVYHFIPLPTTRPEPPSCYFELSGASGYVLHTDIPESVFTYYHMFKTPIECIWNITIESDWQMYINFEKYELTRPNGCEVNYIDIYESVLSAEKRKAHFCGTATEPYKSDGNIINIRFHVKEGLLDSSPDNRGFKFKMLFTAFRTNEKKKCNPMTEFDCDDGTCIASSLKCNSQNNCKYLYDEDPNTTCFESAKGVLILTSNHMIVILIVFTLLVLGMCTSIVVSCSGKIKERRQREMEYKLRRSRETSVEAGLDRAVTVQSLDKNMMALVSGSGMIGSMIPGRDEYSSQHHPLLSSSTHNLPPPGRSHTPVLPAHHAQHHRSHPKLAGLASVGSSGDPVLREEEDGEEGDVDEEDEEMRGNESCYVCNEQSDLQQQHQQQQQQLHHPSHHVHSSASSSAQHLHDRRVLQQQVHEVDEEDDDQYSTDTPPQIISVNCPLYHQHQQHLQQQPHHKSHVSIHSSSQQNVYHRDRSDSDDLIPPPPPPPALSHLRGRVNVLR